MTPPSKSDQTTIPYQRQHISVADSSSTEKDDDDEMYFDKSDNVNDIDNHKGDQGGGIRTLRRCFRRSSMILWLIGATMLSITIIVGFTTTIREYHHPQGTTTITTTTNSDNDDGDDQHPPVTTNDNSAGNDAATALADSDTGGDLNNNNDESFDDDSIFVHTTTNDKDMSDSMKAQLAIGRHNVKQLTKVTKQKQQKSMMMTNVTIPDGGDSSGGESVTTNSTTTTNVSSNSTTASTAATTTTTHVLSPGCETTVLIMRHCEKTGNEHTDSNGDEHCDYLGHERAAFIPSLFGSTSTSSHRRWPAPSFLYALSPDRGGTKRVYRSVETLLPLANEYGLNIEQSFRTNHEIVNDIFDKLASGKVCQKLFVINWRHHMIPNLATKLGCQDCPEAYPEDSFDQVWQLKFVWDIQSTPPITSHLLMKTMSTNDNKNETNNKAVDNDGGGATKPPQHRSLRRSLVTKKTKKNKKNEEEASNSSSSPPSSKDTTTKTGTVNTKKTTTTTATTTGSSAGPTRNSNVVTTTDDDDNNLDINSKKAAKWSVYSYITYQNFDPLAFSTQVGDYGKYHQPSSSSGKVTSGGEAAEGVEGGADRDNTSDQTGNWW